MWRIHLYIDIPASHDPAAAFLHINIWDCKFFWGDFFWTGRTVRRAQIPASHDPAAAFLYNIQYATAFFLDGQDSAMWRQHGDRRPRSSIPVYNCIFLWGGGFGFFFLNVQDSAMLGITASDDPAAAFLTNKGSGKKCMLLLRIYLGDDKNLVYIYNTNRP
jgi:hypothetical protein